MLVDLFLEIARIFNEMAIYILLGLSIAGIFYIAYPKEKISSHLGGNTIYSVIKASFISVPLPMCSCGDTEGEKPKLYVLVLGSKLNIRFQCRKGEDVHTDTDRYYNQRNLADEERDHDHC